ncbi:MAG TPA: hypothetical protein VM884_10495, partial [Flavisolibacter sp.]|nr:hypothetical protein [Flavisolibacter sp.]
LQELIQYYAVTNSVKGTMITIWHNSFLGTDPAFDGWRETYEQFVMQVSAGDQHPNLIIT